MYTRVRIEILGNDELLSLVLVLWEREGGREKCLCVHRARQYRVFVVAVCVYRLSWVALASGVLFIVVVLLPYKDIFKHF